MRRALALAIIAHLLLVAVLTWMMQPAPAGSDASSALPVAVAVEVTLRQTGSGQRSDRTAASNAADTPHAQGAPAAQDAPPDSPGKPLPSANSSAAPPQLSLAGNVSADNASPLDALKRDYVVRLSRHLLMQSIPYPPDAYKRGVEGTVIVTFLLDELGNIVAARVSASSGDAVLDAAAMAAVRERSPLPAPPAGLPVAEMEWDWPVPFRLD